MFPTGVFPVGKTLFLLEKHLFCWKNQKLECYESYSFFQQKHPFSNTFPTGSNTFFEVLLIIFLYYLLITNYLTILPLYLQRHFTPCWSVGKINRYFLEIFFFEDTLLFFCLFFSYL